MPWLAAALFGLSILLLDGCAGVPQGSASMAQQALSFTPPPGKAGFYIIRPYEYTGSVGLEEITFDYQECGSLANNCYLYGTVSPGEHTVKVASGGAASEVVHFTAEPGKNYYFTVKIKVIVTLIGGGPTPLQIDPISETKGQSYVRQFKLTGDNRFELQN